MLKILHLVALYEENVPQLTEDEESEMNLAKTKTHDVELGWLLGGRKRGREREVGWNVFLSVSEVVRKFFIGDSTVMPAALSKKPGRHRSHGWQQFGRGRNVPKTRVLSEKIDRFASGTASKDEKKKETRTSAAKMSLIVDPWVSSIRLREFICF